MAIMKMVLEKYEGENKRKEEILQPSWDKTYLAVIAIEKKDGECVTLCVDDKDDKLFLKIIGGLNSYSLLYTFTEETLPPQLKSLAVLPDEDLAGVPIKVLSAIWIVDRKGAVTAAKEYHEKGYLYDAVDWEMI
jgi:hypothetical protein